MRLINSGDTKGGCKTGCGDHRNTAKLRRGGGCIIMNTCEEEEQGCKTVCYSPARVIVYRLLAMARKCRGGVRREKVNVQDFPADVPVRKSDHRRRINVSGLENQEMTFNLAAGLGLLSLIAASKTELDKTMELRQRMELFLQTFKDENQSKGTTPKQSEPEIAYAVTVSTTLDGLSNYSVDENAASLSQLVYGDAFGCDSMRQKDSSMEGINHLEAELEAELDRMQVGFEPGRYVETGVSSEIQEEVTEMTSENTANNGSVNMSTGEVIDPHQYEDNSECYYGVSPHELERRLHEVLETRHEERIKELEAHLQRMKKKLHEKEVEVAWWKDTAKLISKQVPDASRALR